MSVKDRVLELLKSKEWVDVSDFELVFPPGIEGHLSWGQRRRQLKAEGYRIDKRLKAGTKHTFEYSLVLGEKEPEKAKIAVDSQNPTLGEQAIALPEVSVYPEPSLEPVDANSGQFGFFVKEQGQMVWIG